MRSIVLVPDVEDFESPEKQEFWRNFVWRVRHAIEREGLTAVVLLAEPDKGPAGAKPAPRRVAGW